MEYDHHKKAGNEGDVVKHIALMATLIPLLESHKNIFNYADVFAGYANNQLIPGNEWENGIKNLIPAINKNKNIHIRLYYDWYLSHQNLTEAEYPGSSKIAADIASHLGQKICMSLWDISERVIDNLNRVYKGQRHHIHHCSAGIDNAELERASFIFIDPPGIRSTKYLEFPDWDFFHTLIMQHLHTDMLLWLPLYTDPHGQTDESQEAIEFRENLLLFGNLQATSVQWLTQGEIVGCQLYYRLSAESEYYLQQALEHLVHLMGWDFDDRKSILHYSDRSTLPSGTAVQCDDGIERYVITHQEAIEDDLEYYFTGVECRKGHMCERRVNDCLCVKCEQERNGN